MREAILGAGSDTIPRCARNAKESEGLVQIPGFEIAGGMIQAAGFAAPHTRGPRPSGPLCGTARHGTERSRVDQGLIPSRSDGQLVAGLAVAGMIAVSNPGSLAPVLPRTTLVRTAGELRAALLAAARAPQTIYVDDGAADIDLSYCAQVAPRVTTNDARGWG